MDDPNALRSRIKSELDSGKQLPQIKDGLIKAGYAQVDVDKAAAAFDWKSEWKDLKDSGKLAEYERIIDMSEAKERAQSRVGFDGREPGLINDSFLDSILEMDDMKKVSFGACLMAVAVVFCILVVTTKDPTYVIPVAIGLPTGLFLLASGFGGISKGLEPAKPNKP